MGVTLFRGFFRTSCEGLTVSSRSIVMGLAGLVGLVGFARGGEALNEPASQPLRAGIIGLDTSHVIAFTRLLPTRPRITCGLRSNTHSSRSRGSE